MRQSRLFPTYSLRPALIPLLLLVLLFAVGLSFSACRSEDPLSPEEREIAFYDAVVSCTEEVTGKEYGDVTRYGDTKVPDAALADAFEIYVDCFDQILIERPELRTDHPTGSLGD